MTSAPPTVFLVDNEPSVIRALSQLLRRAGYQVRAFLSSRQFLAEHDIAAPGCVVVELAMPGLNGLQLQKSLMPCGRLRPVIFISGDADIASTVQAMKAGAVDFLTKPVDEDELLTAVRQAMEMDRETRQACDELRSIGERLATLSPREREVFHLIVAGWMSKQAAAQLGITERTIKVHRSRVMEKMGVRSLAELVRTAERIERVKQASSRHADMFAQRCVTID